MPVDSSLAGKLHKGGIQPAQVREELHRIIGCKAMKSDRHKKFLTYIVEQALAGRGDHIKAYTIATQVFDRGDDFDAAADPIVRVEAGRLRRTLEHYYLTKGVDDAVRIGIPKGGYLPEFQINPGNISQESESPVTRSQKQPTSNLPTVIVLPFKFQGTDTDYAYFADGLTEEVSISLSQVKNLRVISGGLSAFPHLDSENTPGICREFNARFALSGTVRVNDSTLRVSIKLYDENSGSQIMGRQYEYPNNTGNLFVIQDDITQQVVLNTADIYEGAIPRVITQENLKKESELTSYDAVLRLHYYNSAFSENAYIDARKAIEKAVKADPENPLVWAALAELSGDGYCHGFWHEDRDTAISNALGAARHALSLDRSCDYAYWTLAITAIEARDQDTVINTAESLLELDPPASTHALAGWSLAIAGQWERGLEILHRNMQILKLYPGWLHHVPFLNYYRQGQYQEALNEATKMNVPMLVWDPLERAAALGQLGKTDAARMAVNEIIKVRPDFIDDPRRYLDCFVMQDELVDHLLDGLIKAGLPEKAATA